MLLSIIALIIVGSLVALGFVVRDVAREFTDMEKDAEKRRNGK